MSTEKLTMKDLNKWFNRNPQLDIELQTANIDWFDLSYERKLEIYTEKNS